MKPKKCKKIDQKKKKISRPASELCDTKTELLGIETGQDTAVGVSRKCEKDKKKLRSFPDFEISTETAPSQRTANTNESHLSVVVATDHSSRAKRRPAKSDHNSGVVRVIDKSRHEMMQRTDDIEEALQLDVGIGSCQW